MRVTEIAPPNFRFHIELWVEIEPELQKVIKPKLISGRTVVKFTKSLLKILTNTSQCLLVFIDTSQFYQTPKS